MQDFRYLSGVTTLEFYPELCVSCGMCELVCPHGVFEVHGSKAEVVDRDACMECGACAMNCPASAITLTPGVGCATYIIKTWIKGKDSSVSCC